VLLIRIPGLFYGTCSFKYPSWKDLVYTRAKGINYLAEYSLKYPSVEIDQWFWSLFNDDPPVLPKKETVAEYASSVPGDFSFTLKAPNSLTLTHFYKKKNDAGLKPNPSFLSVDLYSSFLDSIGEIAGKTGCIMFQFEYLNAGKMPSQREFLDRMSDFFTRIPRDIPCGIELRNPNYLNRPYFDFLDRHDLSHVFLQGYFMPSILDYYGRFGPAIRKMTVIRLHGTERGAIEEKTGDHWDKIVEPRDGELTGIVPMIESFLKRGITVFLNVNNHYEGSAPLTIEKILDRLIHSGSDVF
jgi:uncharacterized protein YecE (DUF72 family)